MPQATPLTNDPSILGAYINRARAHFALGKFQDGISDYQAAMTRAPQNYGLYRMRARDLFDFQKWPESLSDFRKYLSLAQPDENTPYDYLWIWLIRAQQGETAAASKELKTFLADQNDPQEWSSKIGAYLLGEIPEAKLLAAAEDTDAKIASSQKTEAYFYSGMKHLIDGDKSGARERFEKVLEFKKPSFIETSSAKAALKTLSAKP